MCQASFLVNFVIPLHCMNWNWRVCWWSWTPYGQKNIKVEIIPNNVSNKTMCNFKCSLYICLSLMTLYSLDELLSWKEDPDYHCWFLRSDSSMALVWLEYYSCFCCPHHHYCHLLPGGLKTLLR